MTSSIIITIVSIISVLWFAFLSFFGIATLYFMDRGVNTLIKDRVYAAILTAGGIGGIIYSCYWIMAAWS